MSHFLTIIEDEGGHRDWEIEHDGDCEKYSITECTNFDHGWGFRENECDENCTMATYTGYECNVQIELDAIGLDAIDGEGGKSLEPGRYEVKFWFEKHASGPWGPEEYSAGLEVVDAGT